ncbi:MAG: TIGR02253 family HAD-type hydrolase [Chlamydiales bacterium]
MLIVFDLDDTLIDTSGSIIPSLLRCVTENLSEKSQKQLLRINSGAKSSKATLGEFCEISDMEEVGTATPSLEKLQTVGNVKELLRTLALNHDLALVTIGEEELQRSKIMKAEIETHLFSDIIVCKEKFSVYKKLLQKHPYSPAQVVVIGDRVDRDLAPAKLLGCKTIHIKWGRGVNFSDRRGHVDFAISKLDQIIDILHNIEIFS